MKPLSRTLLQILLIGLLAGCKPHKKEGIVFMHPHTVFTAASGGTTSTSPVWQNYSMGESGNAERYNGTMFLGQGAIEIRWQYMGIAQTVPATAGEEGFVDADTYVLVLKTPDMGKEVIPFVYRGGKQIVINRPDLQLIVTQRK